MSDWVRELHRTCWTIYGLGFLVGAFSGVLASFLWLAR